MYRSQNGLAAIRSILARNHLRQATPTSKLCTANVKDTVSNAKFEARRPSTVVDRIIRVDHAGEVGANQIYAGQSIVLGEGPVGEVIEV